MNETMRVPTPKHLAFLNDVEERPLHVGTREVRDLVEFWGYTRNGEEYVKKLVRAGVLVPAKVRLQRGNRFAVEKVLGLWEGGG